MINRYKKFFGGYIFEKLKLVLLLFSFTILYELISMQKYINISNFENLNNKAYIFKIKDNKSYNSKFKKFLPKVKNNNSYIPNLKEIYNSKELFINSEDITNEYIKYIRPLEENEEREPEKNHSEIIFNKKYFKKREDQYSYKKYVKLCQEEKLIINPFNIKYDNNPLISIIVCSYNKENLIIKSIRSIQNQSLKNIEIIIVDDFSIDNTSLKYKYFLESDPRIRIFIIFFDVSDFYEDNYVLEDIFILMEKYNLDSLKMLFRVIKSYKVNKSKIPFHVDNLAKIVYGTDNIIKINEKVFENWGNVWNRIIKKNILLKSLNLIKDKILNVYQNKIEDYFYNLIINKISTNFLVIERIGYVYYWDGKGEGTANFDNDINRNKAIQQEISILYFHYNFLPKNDNKITIINKLKEFNNGYGKYKLSYFRSRFYLLNDLLNILIEDRYILNDEKIFLKKLLNESIAREKKFKI